MATITGQIASAGICIMFLLLWLSSASNLVLFLARESGKPITDGLRSIVLDQYRRYFSVVFVRVQAACLTAGMGHLGLGAREAAGSRKNMIQQEERSRREAEAFFAAYVRGRGMRV